MPQKTKSSSRHLSLLPKRPIPKMPEGYYASGPNPNPHNSMGEPAITFALSINTPVQQSEIKLMAAAE